MSEINLLRDQKQISTEDNKKHSEYHIYPFGYTGGSNKGACKSLRSQKYAGIEIPELTGMKADKGAAEVGTMQHEVVQAKQKKKYATHSRIKFVAEVFIKQEIVPPSDNIITVETERSMKFPKGTKLKQAGITAISPVDMEFYTLIDPAKPGIIMKPIQFANMTKKMPFLNRENTVILEDYDIKSASDFGFYKYLKEGLPWNYQAQGHVYMKANKQKSMTFLLIHKQKNLKYLIKLDFSIQSWEQLVKDQERVLYLAYQILTYDECDEEWEDFECLGKTIGWWFCPLSVIKETTDKKTFKTTQEIIEFCPKAQKLLIEKREDLFPIESVWKNGRSKPHIMKHIENLNGVAVITYTNQGEWNKMQKGNSYTTKEIPLAQAFFKFKPLDYVEPKIPEGQTLIQYKGEAEITMCSDCGAFVDGKCESYGVVPASYPERPEWCFFPIPKEVK